MLCRVCFASMSAELYSGSLTGHLHPLVRDHIVPTSDGIKRLTTAQAHAAKSSSPRYPLSTPPRATHLPHFHSLWQWTPSLPSSLFSLRQRKFRARRTRLLTPSRLRVQTVADARPRASPSLTHRLMLSRLRALTAAVALSPKWYALTSCGSIRRSS